MSSSAPFNHDTASAEALGQRLSITLGDAVPGSRPGKSLLLGFHFGQGAPDSNWPAMISTGIDPIGKPDLYECWWYDGRVQHTILGRTKIFQCGDYFAIAAQVPDASPEKFRALTFDVYQELLQALEAIGRPPLVRVWNYLSNINEGKGDEEKYRQFSIGRAEAFERFGLHDKFVPVATAVGSPRPCDFTVIALATRHGFESVENPRQVSAFNYPRDYGPRSPKFSRGGCVAAGNQRLQLISGTAAIVGHRSVHAGDTGLQCAETLRNLRKLCDAMEAINDGLGPAVLDRDAVLRVYLRDTSSRDFVADELHRFLESSSGSVAYLQAEICRRELQLEIDASKIVDTH